MKKLLLIPVLAVLFSCTKEDIEPQIEPTIQQDTTIVSDSITLGTVDDWDYFITVWGVSSPSLFDYYEKKERIIFLQDSTELVYVNASYDLKGQETFYIKCNSDSLRINIKRYFTYIRKGETLEQMDYTGYIKTIYKNEGFITSGGENGGGIVIK